MEYSSGVMAPSFFFTVICFLTVILTTALAFFRFGGKHPRLTDATAAFLCATFFHINITPGGETELDIVSHFFNDFSLSAAILPIGVYLIFRKISNFAADGQKEGRLRIIVPTFIATILMVFGKLLDEEMGFSFLTQTDTEQWVKVFCFGCGSYLFFYYLTALLYRLFDHYVQCSYSGIFRCIHLPNCIGKLIEAIQKAPFRVSFSLLLLCLTPILLLSYPAQLMSDSLNQILQLYPDIAAKLSPESHFISFGIQERLLSPDCYLNAHHPVVHTLLLRVFLDMGNLLCGSQSFGLFLYACVQTLMLCLLVAFCSHTLVREKICPAAVIPFIILFFVLNEYVNALFNLATKDVFYAEAVLGFILGLYFLLRSKQSGKSVSLRTYCGLAVAMLSIIFFRNDGAYVLTLYGVLVILFPGTRLQALCLMLLASGIYLTAKSIERDFNITPGSKREMLSVPLQQTARYIKQHSHELTREEIEAIDGVLDYRYLLENDVYTPGCSDVVKNRYREMATIEQQKRYIATWWSMLKKHPRTYIEATAANYSQWFYPTKTHLYYEKSGWTGKFFNIVNRFLIQKHEEIHYPQLLSKFHMVYRGGFTLFSYIPSIEVMNKSATYTWFLMILFCYSVSRKCSKAVVLLLFPCCLTAILPLGPCNGNYARYLLPLVVSMPFLILFTLNIIKYHLSDRHE